MTVEQRDLIDFVGLNEASDTVLLVMVEWREWGESGILLPDLENKLNTYFTYVAEGQLVKDYPCAVRKTVRFELRTVFPPGFREKEFLEIVRRQHLDPAGIEFTWRIIKTLN